jgi:hypothetical protein
MGSTYQGPRRGTATWVYILGGVAALGVMGALYWAFIQPGNSPSAAASEDYPKSNPMRRRRRRRHRK